MKSREKKLLKLAKLAKRNPVIGAEELLGVDLPFYQKDILERLWNHQRPLLLCSRRTGKTFTTAVFLTLRALLYPEIKIGIVAPVFRQAQTAFLEVEKLYKKCPLVNVEAISEPKHRNTGWIIEFKNLSFIEAVPLSDNIRSKGYHVVFIDEYGFQSRNSMNSMLESIITPMTLTKRPGVEDDPTDIGNQIVISSTATYKWNDYYEKYQDYLEEIRNGNDRYDVISYDYRDGLESGLFEEEVVKEEVEKADPITRKMEYLNEFPDESGGFITYKLLYDKAIDQAEKIDEEKDIYKEPETQIEFEQEYDDEGYPKHKYILAFDDADQGPSNFACGLIKLDGNKKRLVRIITANKSHISQKIKLIRDLLKNFNIVRIVADQRNKNIKDNLAEPYEYADGEIGNPIVDMDDDEQKKYVRNSYGEDMEELLRIHNFSASTNEMRARHFLSEIEKGRFKIPADPKGGYKSKREEEAYNEIKKAMFEITSIKPKPYKSTVRYETEGNQPKDRWTVCELGCFMADEYIKELGKQEDEDDIPLGKWA